MYVTVRLGQSCAWAEADLPAAAGFGEVSSLTNTVRPLASLAGVMLLLSSPEASASRVEVIRARTRCRFISFPWTRRSFLIGRPSPNPNLTENFQSTCIIGRISTAKQREVCGSTHGVTRYFACKVHRKPEDIRCYRYRSRTK